MKRNSTYSLFDCIKNIEGKEMTNREWLNTTVKLLKEFYEDRDGGVDENLFDCNDSDDMYSLMEMYDVKKAIELAKKSNYGYVIAGYNLYFESCSILTEDTYKNVLDEFLPVIEEYIEEYFDEEKYTWEDIERAYPSLDIKKYIFGDERFVVKKTIIIKDAVCSQFKEFDTYEGGKEWIFRELKALMDGKSEFKMFVDVDEDVFEFHNKDEDTITKYSFIEYTDRVMTE